MNTCFGAFQGSFYQYMLTFYHKEGWIVQVYIQIKLIFIHLSTIILPQTEMSRFYLEHIAVNLLDLLELG